jgi:hypothetical protein
MVQSSPQQLHFKVEDLLLLEAQLHDTAISNDQLLLVTGNEASFLEVTGYHPYLFGFDDSELTRSKCSVVKHDLTKL